MEIQVVQPLLAIPTDVGEVATTGNVEYRVGSRVWSCTYDVPFLSLAVPKLEALNVFPLGAANVRPNYYVNVFTYLDMSLLHR